jgi:hypothetical protein
LKVQARFHGNTGQSVEKQTVQHRAQPDDNLQLITSLNMSGQKKQNTKKKKKAKTKQKKVKHITK